MFSHIGHSISRKLIEWVSERPLCWHHVDSSHYLMSQQSAN